MLVQCTKKLLDELKIKPEVSEENHPLFSWHANLMIVNRKKTVVLVNDQNRYVIVLNGLKAKDFKQLDVLFLQAIREVFQQEGMKDDIIEAYIQKASGIIYTKTKDRTSVARMNKSSEVVYFLEDLLVSDSIVQKALSIRAGRFLVGVGKNDYIKPYEELYKDLEEFFGKSIFSIEAVELRVTLNLENHKVWRKLIVPVNQTFLQFHEIIQVAFGWKDLHLHEFYIFNDKGETEPVVNLVCSVLAFEYPKEIPMKLEGDVKLSEYIPAKIKYLYDLGDGWQHDITVERTLRDYDKNYPACVEGEGTTPPEDVGGEYGYEEFLEIIADQNHPDHERTLKWGVTQGYKAFDLELVNRMLKYREG